MKSQPKTSMFRATVAALGVVAACVLAQAAGAAESAPATARPPYQRSCLWYACPGPATAENSGAIRAAIKRSQPKWVCVSGFYICEQAAFGSKSDVVRTSRTASTKPSPVRVLLDEPAENYCIGALRISATRPSPPTTN